MAAQQPLELLILVRVRAPLPFCLPFTFCSQSVVRFSIEKSASQTSFVHWFHPAMLVFFLRGSLDLWEKK